MGPLLLFRLFFRLFSTFGNASSLVGFLTMSLVAAYGDPLPAKMKDNFIVIFPGIAIIP